MGYCIEGQESVVEDHNCLIKLKKSNRLNAKKSFSLFIDDETPSVTPITSPITKRSKSINQNESKVIKEDVELLQDIISSEKNVPKNPTKHNK